MKGSCGYVGLLLLVVLLVILVGPVMSSRHLPRQPGSGHRHHRSLQPKTGKDQRINRDRNVRKLPPMVGHGKLPDTVQVAGSRLPDCSHACGSCSPCRLVMVSFVCSSIQEAETCPMAYKCMCHNKAYPVP